MVIVGVGVAEAKLPPSGKYGCANYSYSPPLFIGNLKVSGSRYKVASSRWGKILNPKGSKLKFRRGPWQGLYRGRWEKVDSVLEPGKKIVEIELTEIKSGYESTYCTLESR